MDMLKQIKEDDKKILSDYEKNYTESPITGFSPQESARISFFIFKSYGIPGDIISLSPMLEYARSIGCDLESTSRWETLNQLYGGKKVPSVDYITNHHENHMEVFSSLCHLCFQESRGVEIEEDNTSHYTLIGLVGFILLLFIILAIVAPD